MGEIKIEEQFYLFELGGVDLILGVNWLAKLGKVTLNCGELMMAFKQRDKRVVIKGDPTLAKKLVELEALLKMKEVKVVKLVWSLGQTETST